MKGANRKRTPKEQSFFVSSLLEAKADPNSRPKELAVDLAMKSPEVLPLLALLEEGLFAPPEEIKLDEKGFKLIDACERGDMKAVKAAIEEGAKPFYPGWKGKQPLPAAVWGMNPAVVKHLLWEMGRVTPLTWKECEEENRRHNKGKIFMFEKPGRLNLGDLGNVLTNIVSNSFAQKYFLEIFLKKFNDFKKPEVFSWKGLIDYMNEGGMFEDRYFGDAGLSEDEKKLFKELLETINEKFELFKKQIKLAIDIAEKPKAGQDVLRGFSPIK